MNAWASARVPNPVGPRESAANPTANVLRISPAALLTRMLLAFLRFACRSRDRRSSPVRRS